jgi:serine-type D-Ala-D-Ala carboxypeptidase/endopeptidase (penicillin-binding protein 4)
MLATLLSAVLLDARIDRVLDNPQLLGATVGVVIHDAEGRELYSRNPDVRMIPASNQKILSCIYAIATLGPETTLQTKIWKEADGLTVWADGDPSLTSQGLRDAKAKLGTPVGSRVRVRQAFRVGNPPSWEWDDLPYRYAPSITALTVDRGSWSLFADKKGIVAPDPSLGVTVRHRRQTGPVTVRFSPWSKEADVDGALPNERGSIGVFALPAPDVTAAAILGGRLASHEGVAIARMPDLVLSSPPIKTLIKDCLEPSDNLYAEHLMLAAASSSGPLTPGEEYAQAAARMREFFVEKVGLKAHELRPVDGSGLSRQNLVTPLALVKVLRWADSQPWGADFREALAAPGEGTLASRLQTVKFAGKTGTINAVSSLSGIIYPGEGKRLYVSIVFNGAIVSSRVLRSMQDDLITIASVLSSHAHSQSPSDL